MVRAAGGAGLPAIVRVPGCQAAADANRALDCGAAGTLFPRADGAAAARAAVDSVKYAPVGKRGLAGVRANRYGRSPSITGSSTPTPRPPWSSRSRPPAPSTH